MQVIENHASILSDFLGIEEESISSWSDGSYTIGSDDTQEYYVLTGTTRIYSEYIGKHPRGYHIYRN
ncbi:hypothetical protein [Rossellomorea marisflavi]|uniref:hypothetical protein n=1 Tax=Rossellomorea marisflavi TaxID=189381 RepID=UPI0009A5C575|nr:hypothetical protein [Rossellomorea marisflavi]